MTPDEAARAAITTTEILRVGWPITVTLLVGAFTMGGFYFMTKSMREDFTNFRDEKYENDKKATAEEYEKDKKALVDLIKEVKSEQIRGEERIDKKLDQMTISTDKKLDKLFDLSNDNKTVLAKIEGRLYSGFNESTNKS